MSLTIYMGCTAITTNTQVPCFPLNNGYEQLFIASTTGPNLNPEPGSLALLGLGLIALAWTARKRYR
jgi:PEP-CTERM motif-containing protein